MREVFRTLGQNWGVVLGGMLMVALTTTAFYLITVYAPTFGKTVLHLSTSDALLVTLLVGVSNFFWLPIGGALSDRIGRRPVLIGMALLALATTYPALSFPCRRRASPTCRCRCCGCRSSMACTTAR